MDDLGIGLIGLGVHGRRYASHLLSDVPGARLAAVCRSDVKQGTAWAAAHGVPFYSRWQHLVAEKTVDAVVVVTPPDLNAAIACEALAAGKAVLVEKPLATTVADGRRIAAAAAAGPTAMVAQTLRFNAVVKVLAAEIEPLRPLRLLALNQRFEPNDRVWLDRPGPGGILLNTGIHSFDLVRFLSGEEAVEAWCTTAAYVTRRTPDSFVAGLRLADGALASIDNCRATASRSGRIEIVGEHGQLIGDHVLGRAWKVETGGLRELAVGEDVPTVRETLRAFVSCVRCASRPPITVSDGLRALEIVAACELAARERRPVGLDEVS